jgi:dual specificity tyrosine-phosphorylation-regulated kinase 2/3/4
MEQLALMMEVKGPPSNEILEVSSRKKIFYDSHNNPILVPNSRGKLRLPNSKTLSQIIKCQDRNFVNFLEVI